MDKIARQLGAKYSHTANVDNVCSLCKKKSIGYDFYCPSCTFEQFVCIQCEHEINEDTLEVLDSHIKEMHAQVEI